MKRVCFVFNPPKAYEVITGKTGGGGEKLQYNIAKGLKEEGYEIIFIIEKKGVKKITKDTINGFSTYLIPPMSEGMFLIKYVKYIINLIIAIEKTEARCIFQVTPTFSSGIMSIYAKIRNKRFVLYNSSDILSTYKYKMRYKWYFVPFVRLSYSLSSCVVSQHNTQKLNFKRYFGINTPIISNIADIDINKKFVKKRKHFLWVGSNVEVKRQDIMIEIARSLPDVKFVVVSNSICTDNYPSNVEFRQNVSDEELIELYNTSIGLINTSITEGIPNTFLEQWMMGGSVLSLNADAGGGLRKYDYLGKCFDGNIDIMKKEILNRWNSYFNSDYFCELCRRFVIDNYSPDVIIKKWDKLFSNCK